MQDKLMTSIALKQVGGRTDCRDRRYKLAKQLMFGRETESRDILLEAVFAARGALT
jgi:hypothetical protein